MRLIHVCRVFYFLFYFLIMIFNKKDEKKNEKNEQKKVMVMCAYFNDIFTNSKFI